MVSFDIDVDWAFGVIYNIDIVFAFILEEVD
jgi:hypothetical protein